MRMVFVRCACVARDTATTARLEAKATRSASRRCQRARTFSLPCIVMTWGMPSWRVAAAPYTAMVNSWLCTISMSWRRSISTMPRRQSRSIGFRSEKTSVAKPRRRSSPPSQPQPLSGPTQST